MTDRLQALTEAGVSIWLDDLSRERLDSGNLADLVNNSSVVGVTTNPTIFAAAVSSGERYGEQLREEAARRLDPAEVIFELTTKDVRDACGVLATVHEANPFDGRVSIEVSPHLARETEATVAEAHTLWNKVNRRNALIKIPATEEGLPAITQAIAAGISVNVTLIFGIDRYRAVMDAYLTGLEEAQAAGIPLADIHSVASFFVSRVDAEVDKRLDAIGIDEATALRGKAAVANARLAYAAHQEVFHGERFTALKAAGANVQPPLWASTGVKDPAYDDTKYVTELVVDGCINTMPEETLRAFADHGEVTGDTVTGRAGEAQQVFAGLAAVGVDMADVLDVLENEGLAKFEKSWDELVETLTAQLEAARSH